MISTKTVLNNGSCTRICAPFVKQQVWLLERWHEQFLACRSLVLMGMQSGVFPTVTHWRCHCSQLKGSLVLFLCFFFSSFASCRLLPLPKLSCSPVDDKLILKVKVELCSTSYLANNGTRFFKIQLFYSIIIVHWTMNRHMVFICFYCLVVSCISLLRNILLVWLERDWD